jgi:hypothetical protein
MLKDKDANATAGDKDIQIDVKHLGELQIQ